MPTKGLDSYDELVLLVADWMDRNDIEADIPDCIRLAEDEIRSRLRPPTADKSVDLAVVDSKSAVPADLAQVITAYHGKYELDALTPGAARELPDGSIIRAYTIEGADFKFWPAQSTSETVTMLYRSVIGTLSTENPTNVIFAQFPSIYFYGALAEALSYVGIPQEEQIYRAKFEVAMRRAERFFMQKRHGSPLVPRLGMV